MRIFKQYGCLFKSAEAVVSILQLISKRAANDADSPLLKSSIEAFIIYLKGDILVVIYI